MNAKDELLAKLARDERHRLTETRWGKTFSVAVTIWSLVVIPPTLLWAEPELYGVLLTTYAAGITIIVVGSWWFAARDSINDQRAKKREAPSKD